MTGDTPVRALVLPLALSPDQHAMYMEAAGLYNRMWGSIVSWYNTHHTVNAAMNILGRALVKTGGGTA